MKSNLKLLLLVAFLISNRLIAQNPGEWVWVHGDTSGLFNGVFGTQGISAPTNKPPGLYEAGQWTDLNGNFWLFGGTDNNLDSFAALWKYDPITNQWTWMKGPQVPNFIGNFGSLGVPSVTNLPPSGRLGISTWTDPDNNLWMYGGGWAHLWKYNILTNEWTWMKGTSSILPTYGIQGIPDSANSPGYRIETTATWCQTDPNGNGYNLYLFGGAVGMDMGNDLWKYNTVNNMWTWLKGSSQVNQPANYGAIMVEDIANDPGARWIYSHWKDLQGNFWIFGGDDSAGAMKNDLWKYNPLTNNWTWMNGSNLNNSTGNYGTKCGISIYNSPSARHESRAVWQDANGNFLMYGGFSQGVGALNDLWVYCTSLNQWIWLSNDSISTNSCSWGTMGISDPSNKPAARWGALAWSSQAGELFIFGGHAAFAFGSGNDLWKYKIDTTCYCPNSLSIDESADSFDFIVSPNPISNQLSIRTNKFVDKGTINIYNSKLQLIDNRIYHGYNLNLNLDTPQGIYFIVLIVENHLFSKKVIVD